MARKINKNLSYLIYSYRNSKHGVVLSGGSRSGKTFSCVDFIIWLATVENFTGVLNIVRETYNSFKTTLYNDFRRRLSDYNLPNPFLYKEDVQSLKINNLKINFLGCDNPATKEGASHDITYYNEFLDIPQSVFDALEQRCQRFWFADFNPKYQEHWVFSKVLKRHDVGFIESTLFDNPFVSEPEKNKILSYEPTPENEARGTADIFRWKVYGLGQRAPLEGLFFVQDVNYKIIDEIPKEVKRIPYGLDFGFNPDPVALVEIFVGSGENKNCLYINELLYETGLSNIAPDNEVLSLDKRLRELNVSQNDIIIADNERKSIQELQMKNWLVMPAVKGPDSILPGIQKMVSYKLHITKNSKNLIEELQGYSRMKNPLTGLYLPQPDPKIRKKHCFEGNTLIITKSGYKKIKDITLNDYVLTSTGYKKVLKKFNNGYSKVFDFNLIFSAFEINIICTDNHKIKTLDGWKEISLLKKQNVVYLPKFLMDWNIKYLTNKSIIPEVQKDFIGLFGNILMGKSILNSIYIIKTKIYTITILKIWSLLIEVYIKAIIVKKELLKIKNGFKNFIQKVLNLQKNGINLMKAMIGTKNMQKNTILGNKPMGLKLARYVILNLKQKQKNKNFVQTNANHNIEETQELTTYYEYVKNVEKNLLQTNSQKINIVQKNVLLNVKKSNPRVCEVFDLMIEENHEYFANNILVHNCLDGARYAVNSNYW